MRSKLYMLFPNTCSITNFAAIYGVFLTIGNFLNFFLHALCKYVHYQWKQLCCYIILLNYYFNIIYIAANYFSLGKMKYRLVWLDLINDPLSFIFYDIMLNTLNIVSRYSMSNSVYQALFRQYHFLANWVQKYKKDVEKHSEQSDKINRRFLIS